MIICNNNSIDIIQGVIGYGNAEGITDWRLENTSTGVFNILNSTSSTPNISIIDNGNVGIGTVPTPTSSKLEIIGDVNISGNYRKNNIDIISDTSNYVLSTSNILSRNIENSSSRQWTTNNNMIYYNTSNVGIGTTNPISKLHLFDDPISETKLTIQNNNVTAVAAAEIISSPAADNTGTIIGTIDKYMIFKQTEIDYTITVPTGGITCDILIVAGGGAGGSFGGGGGAGGLIYLSNLNISSGQYIVKVGRGGTINNNGSNSSFYTYIAIGGGKGTNAGENENGIVGGSGGGGITYEVDGENRTYTYGSIGGQGTLNQGNSGGNGGNGYGLNFNIVYNGGGGGGAGSVGQNGPDNGLVGGNGGIGKQYDITGISTYYAGGGGGDGDVGGAGGLGGGGKGSNGRLPGYGGVNGEDGVSNTGGGGGAGFYGTSGGSGIVIIRYRKVVSSASIELIRLSNNSVNEIVITGTTSTIVGTDRCIQFPYSGSGATMSYSFITSETLICDLLIVGGGGGGTAGGGGGGGYLYYTNINLPAGNNYVVNVGNGGTGTTGATNGNQGANSSFIGGSLNYIAYGGGGGGGNSQIAPAHTTGQVGSYGGNGADNNTQQTYTSTQGNRGGNPSTTAYGSGGGGGGADRVGDNPIYVNGVLAGPSTSVADRYSNGGMGGNGKLNNITGTAIYYAGGGTGGANTNNQTNPATQIPPIGGGGMGSRAPNANGTNGTNGLGGGGGGGDWERTAGTTGGSGIVIMRYRKVANYKIGNYYGDFIVKSSINGSDTDYIKITGATGAISNPAGTTSWTTASDRRIKENIERASYDKCYESIKKLELNRFNYINGFNTINRDITQLGFIAQEVKEIFPKSVFENSYINNNINISDLQSIDTTQINYTLYGAVKKLIEKVNNNVKRIKYLKNILNIDIDTTSTSNNLLIN